MNVFQWGNKFANKIEYFEIHENCRKLKCLSAEYLNVFFLTGTTEISQSLQKYFN